MSDQTRSETPAKQPEAPADRRLLLSISEASSVLGVSRMTIIRRIRSGAWRSGRCGRKHYLSRAFVDGAAAAVARGIDIDAYAKTFFGEAAEEMAS